MTSHRKSKYVVFAGGETAGPLMPLLAVAQKWQEEDPHLKPVFVDVAQSVAAEVVPDYKFIFHSITTGKLRRYWSLKTILMPALLIVGFVQALMLLAKYRPLIVVGAGGYVQVPVVLAAWIMRIPRLVHQQDVIVTLANKVVAPVATKITTTFESSLRDFLQGSGFNKDYSKLKKVVWVGNPGLDRISKANKQLAIKQFGLSDKWPTLLVVGGGSGAAGLNDKIIQGLPMLTRFVQIIHSTGRGKKQLAEAVRYHPYEFIDRMDLAYAAADIVIARAGIGTLTELAELKKVSIIIPMPGSHQEANAELVYRAKGALVLDQRELEPEMLAKVIRKVLMDASLQHQLKQNISRLLPHNASSKMLKVIQEIIE
jgi:UDP-N-acetylglucosamine--N-acetylmuramyl-(pentapeptide) pyrophosphoryl-undecaprenol N-acetylglucosamine transferase